MIILVKNYKDVLQASLDAINRLLVDDNKIFYDKNHEAFIRVGNPNKVIVSYFAMLQALKFTEFIGLDALRAYCFAAEIISSNTDTKKDKLLFGAKLFGLVVLGAPLALVALLIMLQVTTLSYLITCTSLVIDTLVGQIKNLLAKKMPHFHDFINKYAVKEPTESLLRELLSTSVLYLLFGSSILIVFLLIILPRAFSIHPITCLAYLIDRISGQTTNNPTNLIHLDEENLEGQELIPEEFKDLITPERVPIEAFLEQALQLVEYEYPLTLEKVLKIFFNNHQLQETHQYIGGIKEEVGASTDISDATSNRITDPHFFAGLDTVEFNIKF